MIPFQPDPDVVWEQLGEQRGRLAFDVGANSGEVARRLARKFRWVVAFEPCFESFEHLKKAPLCVTAVNAAVSDADGDVVLQVASKAIEYGELVTGSAMEFAWGAPVGERTVTAVTLDTAAANYGIPDFVKVDTEGHEVRVIAGGAKLFAEHSPRLLIEIHDGPNADQIEAMLPGYRWERVLHPGYREGSPHRHNHFYMWGER